MSHPGRPGKVPGRGRTGSRDPVTSSTSFDIPHFFFLKENFAIFKSMYVCAK